jgi:hypothetical protein
MKTPYSIEEECDDPEPIDEEYIQVKYFPD